MEHRKKVEAVTEESAAVVRRHHGEEGTEHDGLTISESGLAETEINRNRSHTPVGDTPPLSFADTTQVTPRQPVEVSVKSLLEAGVHFGHQTARWNPKMAPYIHSARNGIHIINLPMTVNAFEAARKKVVEVASRGGSILFVGTKKQAQDAVVEEAARCGAFYVSRRWLGGMLTNFQTIRKSIDRMNKLEEILLEEDRSLRAGEGSKFKKKERLMMHRERDKLYYSLGGIRTMYGPPALIFVIDVKREAISLQEANRLDIPIVALVDTNCDPANVDYAIPSNDDGTRAIRFFCEAIADAVLAGKSVFKERMAAQRKEEQALRKAAQDKAKADATAESNPKRAEAAEPSAKGEESATTETPL